jgi:hypothetical protein
MIELIYYFTRRLQITLIATPISSQNAIMHVTMENRKKPFMPLGNS